MDSRSEPVALRPRERADYGFSRVRDLAYDAVRALWERRRQNGLRQADLAEAIGRDPAWVSRSLGAPGNWTLRTIGELVEGLDGEIEIIVHPIEDMDTRRLNFDAYAGYRKSIRQPGQPSAVEDSGQIVEIDPQGGQRATMQLSGLKGTSQIII